MRIQDEAVGIGRIVLMIGPPGTSKTMLALLALRRPRRCGFARIRQGGHRNQHVEPPLNSP